MIYLFTNRPDEFSDEVKDKIESSELTLAKPDDFTQWYDKVKLYDTYTQLDVESNVVEKIYFRELYVVQVGSQDKKSQWLFDIGNLDEEQEGVLLDYLNDQTVYKICHNAMFEYTLIKWAFGIRIKKLRDTYLMSDILSKGIKQEKGFHSLKGCLSRYMGIDMDKTQQTTYSTEPMTWDQIKYAATDVLLLCDLHEHLQKEIDYWGEENTVRLECAFLRSMGDGMTWNWYLNKEDWQVNIDNQEATVKEVTEQLHTLIKEQFYDESVNLGFIQRQDEYGFDWKGRKVKTDILKAVYPELPEDCTTISGYKNYLNLLKDGEVDGDPIYLELVLSKNYEELEMELIKNYDDELRGELNLFKKRGDVLINFNSPVQKLQFFQLIDPTLESSNQKALSKLSHPVVKMYKALGKAQKLLQSYGKGYLDAIDPDGMLRIPGVTQILETGRASMKLYQILPGDNTYRNPFHLKEDWVGCGADYASQELCVMATFAGDETMLQAIRDGKDLHSVGAAALFPKEWADAGEDPECFGKPKTKTGNAIRKNIKALNFGIPYGKSAVGLADDLNIPVGVSELIEENPGDVEKFLAQNEDDYSNYCSLVYEGKQNKTSQKTYLKDKHVKGLFLKEIVTADDLIRKYFETFPGVRDFLEGNGESAVQNCYIRMPDLFGRIRFFSPPIDNGEKAAIKRQGQNAPIQGSSANITKYAAVLIANYLDENDLNDDVKFLGFLHDELWYAAKRDFAEEWMEKQCELMELAAEKVLKNDLLKVEGDIFYDQKWHK